MTTVQSDNAARVMHFLERATKHPEEVWDIFHEDVVWDLTGILAVPDFPRKSQGPDSVREFFRRWAGTFADWGYAVEDLKEGPNTVLVRIHQWGSGRESGAPVDSRFWQTWVMFRGQAIRVSHRLEEAEALRDAGL